jgi:drug/metabolite transporter (DMT)-like permease
MTRLRADLLLLLTALIWGTAFVAQKEGDGAIGPLGFVAGRFVLSAFLMAPLAWRESRTVSTPTARGEWALTGAIGLCLTFGSILQQVGLRSTSVTNAGFITSLYIAFVPLVAWLVLGTRVRPLVFFACAVSLAGAWLLAKYGRPGLTDGVPSRLETGDWLVLISALLFAGHIVLVSIFLKRTHRPFLLSFVQTSTAAGIGWILYAIFEPVSLSALQAGFSTIAYAGIVSGGIGYALQLVGQRHTPAAEAAFIMSLESVFAALAAALLLGERLSLAGWAGCALILAGVIMVEVLPALPGFGGGAAEDEPILGAVPMD